MMALAKYEFKETLRNPSMWILVMLPVIMSKIVIQFMAAGAPHLIMLPTWILFAQVLVGVMMTGPNLLEERYSKTMDALLVTPIGVYGVVLAKALVVLTLSLVSQALVMAFNTATFEMFGILPLMFIGAVVAIEVGMLIGLILTSPKSGSALASAVMVLLFLAGAISTSVQHPNHVLQLVPSVEVIANIASVMATGAYLPLQTAGILAWMLAAGVGIVILVRRYRI